MSEGVNGDGTRVHLSAEQTSGCFVCGTDNPCGLHLRFAMGERGEMRATWIPDSAMEGFNGIIHGGVVSTVLDESMAKAVTGSGAEALTAELRVRFRRHVVANRSVEVFGWIASQQKRILRAEASLVSSDGTELAHAWASFLVLR